MKLSSLIRRTIVAGSLISLTAFGTTVSSLQADIEGPREEFRYLQADVEGPREELLPGMVQS